MYAIYVKTAHDSIPRLAVNVVFREQDTATQTMDALVSECFQTATKVDLLAWQLRTDKTILDWFVDNIELQ